MAVIPHLLTWSDFHPLCRKPTAIEKPASVTLGAESVFVTVTVEDVCAPVASSTVTSYMPARRSEKMPLLFTCWAALL